MIWIAAIAIIYHLIISAASLFIICSGEEKESYYDIRNIAVAFGWPLVLLWTGIVKASHFITKKTSSDGSIDKQ